MQYIFCVFFFFFLSVSMYAHFQDPISIFIFDIHFDKNACNLKYSNAVRHFRLFFFLELVRLLFGQFALTNLENSIFYSRIIFFLLNLFNRVLNNWINIDGLARMVRWLNICTSIEFIENGEKCYRPHTLIEIFISLKILEVISRNKTGHLTSHKRWYKRNGLLRFKLSLFKNLSRSIVIDLFNSKIKRCFWMGIECPAFKH